ncbi:MAG TPA: hypothetical protein VKE41_12815, partial [Roseiflexaceae bacterium]|nr:hypothetical protein [Roseiflexaceae bacterium]
MASQEDIAHQQTLLATYRGNLRILLRQASKYGDEEDAPLQIVNGIRGARDNIRRVKSILRGWGVTVEDLPDEQEPGAATGA